MPLSSSPVLNAEQRAWRYWFADGFSTLVAGLGCLLCLSEDSSGYPGLTVLSLQDAEFERLLEAERLYADRTRRMLVTCAAVLLAMFGIMLIPNRWICVAAGIVMSIGLWIGTRKEQPLS